MSRRDAAVAAALAGAVVVVLGYASGLGVKVEPPITTVSPVDPVETPTPAEDVAPITESAPLPAVATLPETVPTPTPEAPDHTGHPTPTEPDPDPDPSSDPDPDPSPDPSPGPDGPGCASLLEGLPVVGPATDPLTSLVSGLLATTEDVLGLAGSASSPEDRASLDCLLGAVIGPRCCASEKSDRPRDAR